jgi:hypothetical protein
MFRFLVFLALAAAIAIPAPAQTSDTEAKGTLQGRVTDNYGAGITTAFVYVQGANNVSQQVPVTESGDFSVQLPPGIYNFFVGSTGFAPFAKEIKVSLKKPVIVKVKLHVDLDISLDD